MSDLATFQLMGTGSKTPHYARMIFGCATRQAIPTAASVEIGAKPGKRMHNGLTEVIKKRPENLALAGTEALQARMRALLPHPAGDGFLLFQAVAADFIVLACLCIPRWLFSYSWGLRWLDLPIFAVLVTLFGYSEGLYSRVGESYCAGVNPVLARSTLFASVLISLYDWRAIRILGTTIIFISSLGALTISRKLAQFSHTRRRHESKLRRVLIVGAGPTGSSLARALRDDTIQRNVFCGFLDDDLPLSPAVLGRIADLDWLARAQFVDEVILNLPGRSALTRQVAETALRNHLDIRAVPDLPLSPRFNAEIDRIGDIPVLTLHREKSPTLALFLKRLLDITGAVCALAFAAPVMALVAALIRLDSPGPALYSAKRTGAKGRIFRCHKFRSMVTDAERLKGDLQARNQREGPIFKIEDDPRITRVGRFIRRYSLDELPQLWNVLRGDMSLVGPRPHPVAEVNHYELHHYRRLDVKPGITGLWQIKARKSPSFDVNMHLDLAYIENWSLGLDISILAATVRVLFAPEGA